MRIPQNPASSLVETSTWEIQSSMKLAVFHLILGTFGLQLDASRISSIRGTWHWTPTIHFPTHSHQNSALTVFTSDHQLCFGLSQFNSVLLELQKFLELALSHQITGASQHHFGSWWVRTRLLIKITLRDYTFVTFAEHADKVQENQFSECIQYKKVIWANSYIGRKMTEFEAILHCEAGLTVIFF